MGKLKSSSSSSLSPSNSMVMRPPPPPPPPPTMLRSSNYINADAHDYHSRRQLALIPPPSSASTSTSGFKLPHGWDVQEVPRSDPSRVDKYYYEPGTGLKFRSLRAVERYINGEEFNPTPRALTWHNNHYKSPGYRKMNICGGKMMRLNEETLSGSHLAIVASGKTAANSPYNLPDGWVVEEFPRRDYSHTDKISLKETDQSFKLGRLVKNSVSCKKQYRRNNTQTSSLVSPPMKVNWVLASPRGDAWNPFIFDSEIPDSVKQQWNERFMLAMNVDNHDRPHCRTPS